MKMKLSEITWPWLLLLAIVSPFAAIGCTPYMVQYAIVQRLLSWWLA